MAVKGVPGSDVTMYVPLGISVTSDTGQPLGDINTAEDKICVARGGAGGGPKEQFRGQIGERRHLRLDLKVLADIGLVGFPNAGKSTMLSVMSEATPRIASYPFTTIEPELGIMQYLDYRQISMADLPGLIEGASQNVGLGHRFLRHVERTRLLLFVIDVNGFQLSPMHPHRTAFETLVLLNKELELYKESLIDKPALLAVNKMDLPGAREKYDVFAKQIQNYEEATNALEESLRPK
ncbi:GTP-binding protein 10, partial [Hypsibius exemplaris]